MSYDYGRKPPTFFKDNHGDLKLRWVFTLVFGGMLALGIILAPAIVASGNRALRIQCGNYSEATGLNTKVEGGFWHRTCYIQSADGNWAEYSQYRVGDGV